MKAPSPTDARPARGWLWVIQLAVAALVVTFVWRAVARDLEAFRDVAFPIEPRLGPLVLAMLAVWTSYLLLIAAWRAVLAGWGQSIRSTAAVRVWCVSNLGRYLPGKVWSIAGLAVLAQREGVQGWAAAGSALAMQAISIGTGAAVSLAMLPRSGSVTALAGGLAVAVISMAALTSKRFMSLPSRFTGSRVELQPLPVAAVASGALASVAAWILYGTAFWLLGVGLVPSRAPSLATAVGVFPVGYIVGLLALFAPGGLVVREGVLLGLLTPSMGTGAALAMSIGSRLLLTLTEVGAAVLGVGLHRAGKGKTD